MEAGLTGVKPVARHFTWVHQFPSPGHWGLTGATAKPGRREAVGSGDKQSQSPPGLAPPLFPYRSGRGLPPPGASRVLVLPYLYIPLYIRYLGLRCWKNTDQNRVPVFPVTQEPNRNKWRSE